jgi:hypothetical protein
MHGNSFHVFFTNKINIVCTSGQLDPMLSWVEIKSLSAAFKSSDLSIKRFAAADNPMSDIRNAVGF